MKISKRDWISHFKSKIKVTKRPTQFRSDTSYVADASLTAPKTWKGAKGDMSLIGHVSDAVRETLADLGCENFHIKVRIHLLEMKETIIRLAIEPSIKIPTNKNRVGWTDGGRYAE